VKHVVSYSGGLGSFAAALKVKRKWGECTLVFTDTKTEDPDLYRFLVETSEALGCELVTLADGRDIWQVFEDVKFHGNSLIDPCSRILKRELFRKHMEATYDPAETVLYFGIDDRESHRMVAIKRNWQPWNTSAPLCDDPMSREEILNELDVMGIDPPALYEMGFPHNNCGGFCVKTGQKQMKLLLEKLPERYAWHEERQENLFAKIGKKHGFIRKVIRGELAYLSLKEFREMLSSGEKAEGWIEEGCGCFV